MFKGHNDFESTKLTSVINNLCGAARKKFGLSATPKPYFKGGRRKKADSSTSSPSHEDNSGSITNIASASGSDMNTPTSPASPKLDDLGDATSSQGVNNSDQESVKTSCSPVPLTPDTDDGNFVFPNISGEQSGDPFMSEEDNDDMIRYFEQSDVSASCSSVSVPLRGLIQDTYEVLNPIM